MIRKFFILICLVVAVQQLQAQVAEIKPEHPQRGAQVIITYHPDASGAKISNDAKNIDMVFTYSTFYELPWRLPMKKEGDSWVASFVLQRYATFATFYFQSGEQTDQPSADKHYSIPVYTGNKRVRDGFLHESYSLGAQMPKSAKLPALQLELLHKELANYPDNYEAKVRVQSINMAMAKTPGEKQKFREEARKIIAAKFEENPTFGGNLNKVTMGYLIIGENSRLDSIRKVVAERYPKSDLAISYRTSMLAKERDPVKKIAALEALLKESDERGEEGSMEIHGILFEYYASAGNAAKAVYHARRSLGKTNPYTPNELKDVAVLLTAHKLVPDTAINYATRSLKMVNQWPVGVIRYFPEYGYILPFVADSVRALAIAGAKSDLLSIIALNKLYLKDADGALNYAAQSEAAGENRESLVNIASVYEQIGNYKKAYDSWWKVLLKDPSDTIAITSAKNNFLKFNPSVADFNSRLKTLEALKTEQLKVTLRKQLMNKPGPELNGITDLSGKPLDKSLLKGKVVVMDFWATWCIPCMEELPYLQKVYDLYKNNPDVVFMVINSGARNTIDDARGWAKKNAKYSFPLYFNNDKDIGEKVGFTLIPTVALLDKSGKMQFRTIGFEGAEMEAKLTQQIEILLNGNH